MKPLPAYFEAHQHSYGETAIYIRELQADRHRLYDLLERIVQAHKDGEPDTAALLAAMALADRPEEADRV
jgi:hypothetical protein